MALSRLISGRFLMNTFYHMRVKASGEPNWTCARQTHPSGKEGCAPVKTHWHCGGQTKEKAVGE